MRKGAWINGRPKPCITKHDANVAKAHAVAQAIMAITAVRFQYPYQLNDAIRVAGMVINED